MATATAPEETRRLAPGALLPIQHRTAEIRAEDIEERSVDLVFSTEAPVERMFGDEVLVHGRNNARMTRINTAAPLLWNHDTNDQIGVVEHARVDADGKKGRARVRFSASARGEEFFQDVKDGIRSLVSFGYRIHKTEVEQRGKNDPDLVRVTDWEPYEISLVSVPADIDAGVGRASQDRAQFAVEVAVRGEAGVAEVVAVDSDHNPTTTTNSQIRVMNEPDNKLPFDADEERKKAKAEAWANLRAYDQEADALKERSKNTQLKPDVVESVIRQFRESGDVQALRAGYLEALGDPKHIETVKPVEMSAQQVRNYSLCKAIRQMANQNERLDGFELEMHQECERSAPDAAKGFFVPMQVAKPKQTRAIGAISGAEGNETVPTNIGDLIELLRDNMVVQQLGSTMLSGLSGNVQLPRVTATASSAWDAEADALTETSQTFDTVTLSPKRAGVTTYYSKQLLIQSSLDVENFVRQDQARSMGNLIDKGVLYGTGASDQPTGVVTTVQASGNTLTFGGAATYADYVDAWEQVATANGAMGRMAYLTTPPAIEKGLTIEAFSSTGKTLITGTPGEGFSCLGYPVVSVTTLTDGTDVNLLIFGNWQELIWATFGNGMDVVVDPYTRAGSAQIVITSNMFVDAAVRHATSFTCSTDSAAQ